MTSHIHMIIGRNGDLSLSDIVRDLKSFTSRHTRKAIESNCEESKKEWMMWIMRRVGFVEEPTAWSQSSARDYAGEEIGRIELIFIE